MKTDKILNAIPLGLFILFITSMILALVSCQSGKRVKLDSTPFDSVVTMTVSTSEAKKLIIPVEYGYAKNLRSGDEVCITKPGYDDREEWKYVNDVPKDTVITRYIVGDGTSPDVEYTEAVRHKAKVIHVNLGE